MPTPDASLPRHEKAMGNQKSSKINWALNHIQKLHRIETQLKAKTINERYRIIQEIGLPRLAQFKIRRL
jgi:transposase